MRKLFVLIIAIVMVAGMATTAFAAGTVTYEGSSREFIFEPGSEFSPTDLFDGFKGVMPGDVHTQQVLIKNDVDKDVKIKLYMRSLGAQEGTEEFLSQMDLTVKQKGDSELFKAPGNESAQLTNWVYLGTIYSGGEITLDISLEVPIEMGSDFSDKIGYVDWQFKVEEFPVEEDDPKPPKTGDSNKMFIYLGLLVLSSATLVRIYIRSKKNQKG